MSKKITIVCNLLNGLFNAREEILKVLIDNNYTISVIAPENEFVEKLKIMGIEFFPINMELRGTNPFKDFDLMKNYKRILKCIKPDLVLSYTIKPNVYAGYVCRKLGIPFIANVTGLGTSVENPGLLQLLTVNMYKIGLKNAHCVFFQNQDNLDFMLKHKVIKENYKLIPGSGVNLEKFTYVDYPNHNIIKFLFVSRIMYEKGIEDYLNTAEYIKNKYSNTEFHIFGKCDSDKYNSLLDEYEKKKIVIYHGRVNNMKDYYADSNCTIHPSFYPEGMSNVLLESCATGRPIITTNRPGCKEVVDDGINGYLIECRDTDALKERVEKFLNLTWEEKRQMGLNGRKKVEKEFDRNIVINEYLKEIGV